MVDPSTTRLAHLRGGKYRQPGAGREATERRAKSENDEVREGAGCYSPLFPARADDVLAGAVAVVKFIEESIQEGRDDTELVVLQSSQYGGFSRSTMSSMLRLRRVSLSTISAS